MRKKQGQSNVSNNVLPSVVSVQSPQQLTTTSSSSLYLESKASNASSGFAEDGMTNVHNSK